MSVSLSRCFQENLRVYLVLCVSGQSVQLLLSVSCVWVYQGVWLSLPLSVQMPWNGWENLFS